MISKSSKLFSQTIRTPFSFLSNLEASQAGSISAASFATRVTKTKPAAKKTPAKKASKEKIFVTGSSGQIGKALIPRLCEKYGAVNVMATDVVKPSYKMESNFLKLDITQKKKFATQVESFKPTKIIHLAAILSATAEANPQLALDVNLGGFQNALNAAHKLGAQIYCPSTLAVYGPDAPKTKSPLHTALRPTSIYGITKVENELLGGYYKDKFGVDYRSLRYVGIMSSEELPMHGTTDYSTDMIIKALQGKKTYQVYLTKDRKMPMMYIDEAIEATLIYIEAPLNKLSSHIYNLNGATVSPQDFAKQLSKKFPGFKVTYKPDHREQIAKSWPTSINDSLCTKDWGWSSKITPAKLVKQVIDGYEGNQGNKAPTKKATLTKRAQSAPPKKGTAKATPKKTAPKKVAPKKGPVKKATASKAKTPAKRGRAASSAPTTRSVGKKAKA